MIDELENMRAMLEGKIPVPECKESDSAMRFTREQAEVMIAAYDEMAELLSLTDEGGATDDVLKTAECSMT